MMLKMLRIGLVAMLYSKKERVLNFGIESVLDFYPSSFPYFLKKLLTFRFINVFHVHSLYNIIIQPAQYGHRRCSFV